MKPEGACSTIGCLMIDDLMSGGGRLAGLSACLQTLGLNVCEFSRNEGANLHAQVQTSYHKVRNASDIACVLAAGTGCAAALALSEQLPVDRMVLIDDGRTPHTGGASAAWRRQVNRLAGFARRNLTFCVSDVLLLNLDGKGGRRRLETILRGLCHGQAYLMDLCDDFQDDFWTTHENVLKKAIYAFLEDGELPKSLAENSEMCIIYR